MTTPTTKHDSALTDTNTTLGKATDDIAVTIKVSSNACFASIASPTAGKQSSRALMMSTTITVDGKAPSNTFASRNVFASRNAFATSKVTKMTDDIVVADKSVSAAGKSRRFASIANRFGK